MALTLTTHAFIAMFVMQLVLAPALAKTSKQVQLSEREWFARFDDIRRAAECREDEREEGNLLMLKTMVGSASAEERVRANVLLRKLRDKYKVAAHALSQLSPSDGTEALKKGYMAYFAAAANLCSTCIKENGEQYSEHPGEKLKLLLEQKQLLDELGHHSVTADELTRIQLRVEPYSPTRKKLYFAEQRRVRP